MSFNYKKKFLINQDAGNCCSRLALFSCPAYDSIANSDPYIPNSQFYNIS